MGLTPEGPSTKEVSPERASTPALDDAQAGLVAGWTRAISTALGAPQDVEWALCGSPARVVLLQARPITTLPREGAAGARADLPAERQNWR